MSSRIVPAMTREEAEVLLKRCEIHAAFRLEIVTWELGVASFSFAPPGFVRTLRNGGVHGGALVTALDTAACFAAISAVGIDCVTLDLRTDFLRPAVDDTFFVHGEVLRAGRRFASAEARLITVDDRLLAKALGTFTWQW